MHLRITQLAGNDEGHVARFEGSRLEVGRDPACDLRLVQADDVASARHLEIVREDGAYWILDLDSTNGTWVEGKQVSRHQLRDGDVVELGPGGPQLRINLEPGPLPPDEPGVTTIVREVVSSRVQEASRKTAYLGLGAAAALVVLIAAIAWLGSGRLTRLREETAASVAALDRDITATRAQLDTEVAGLEQALAQVELRTTTRMDSIQADLDQSRQELSGRIDSVDQRVGAAEGEIQRVGFLAEQNRTTIFEGLASLEDRMGGAESRLASLEEEAARATDRLVELEAARDAITQRLESQRERLSAIADTQQADARRLTDELQRQQARVDQLNGLTEQARAQAAAAVQRAEGQSQQIAEIRDRYYQLSHRVHALNGGEPDGGLGFGPAVNTDTIQSDARSGGASSTDNASRETGTAGGPSQGVLRGASDVRAAASSARAEHPAASVLDSNPSTFWAASGDAVPTLNVLLRQPAAVRRIELVNGAGRQFDEFSRAAQMTLVFSDGSRRSARFQDTGQRQGVTLDPPVTTTQVSLQITKAYAGASPDPALSEVQVFADFMGRASGGGGTAAQGGATVPGGTAAQGGTETTTDAMQQGGGAYSPGCWKHCNAICVDKGKQRAVEIKTPCLLGIVSNPDDGCKCFPPDGGAGAGR